MLSANVFRGMRAKGYIAPTRYVHGPVRFTYKVPYPEYRAEFFSRLHATDDKGELQKLQASMLAGCVVEWNQFYREDHPDKEKAGKQMPLDNADVMARELQQPVFVRMASIVMGMSESDADPEDQIEDQLNTIENQKKDPADLQRMMSEADEAQLGNSPEA